MAIVVHAYKSHDYLEGHVEVVWITGSMAGQRKCYPPSNLVKVKPDIFCPLQL